MTSREPWIVDPDDPRAPPTEVWRAMSAEERARVVASLPSEWDDALPPEGDRHFNPKVAARKTLERYFSRIGRSVYVGSELPVYYPGEKVIAPDVMAVLDVELRERDSWVVDQEGKGLDFALEIHVSGRRKKDQERNVERYAKFGITDYFMFDRRRVRLYGWTLPTPTSRAYSPVVPQAGRYRSQALGLELSVIGDRLRFLQGDAELPDPDELIARLERALDSVEQRADEEAKRAEEEAKRAEEEAKRAEEEAGRRAELEQRLAAALAEIERLKR